MSAAEHPGFTEMYSMISNFNLSSLADFCDPFPFMNNNTTLGYKSPKGGCPGSPQFKVRLIDQTTGKMNRDEIDYHEILSVRNVGNVSLFLCYCNNHS
jgi:hypothetical protein